MICDQLTNAASVDDLAYYSLLVHSRQVYLELKQNSHYRSEMLKRCKFSDKDRKEKDLLLDKLDADFLGDNTE